LSTTMSGSGAGVERVFNNTQSLSNVDYKAPRDTVSEISGDAFPASCKKTKLFPMSNSSCKYSN
jgi:4-diphosphocytidyl-2C-methyl-D-erythritol kinase